MPHDLAHEEKQNQAIRELAGAVAGLAGKMGAPDVIRVVARVEEILKADDTDLESSEAMVVAPPASPAVVDAEFDEVPAAHSVDKA